MADPADIDWVKSKFENAEGKFSVTSPNTDDYNCIAWAAEDATQWWWPDAFCIAYWPPGVPRAETPHAFELAYSSIGYRKCESGEPEEGFDKIAIYFDAAGTPTHAARMLASGKWTSKLGNGVDISHDTDECLGGVEYGTPQVYMKRPR